MQAGKTRNLGATSLRARRRSRDPMKTYDALPEPLRQWLAQATLPWSPVSASRLWERARAEGCSVHETLQSLSQAELRTLARDKYSTQNQITHTS